MARQVGDIAEFYLVSPMDHVKILESCNLPNVDGVDIQFGSLPAAPEVQETAEVAIATENSSLAQGSAVMAVPQTNPDSTVRVGSSPPSPSRTEGTDRVGGGQRPVDQA